METDSGQRATLRRREGARGRRERRLRVEARIRLQLCRDAVLVVERASWPERSASSTTAYGHRSDLSRGRGQHRCWRCCRRWHTRSSMPFLGCRRSMVLCRLWWNSWWTCSSSLTRSFLLPSRLSTCPRSSSSASCREPRFASRSWRNSWWKYRRSIPILPCSGVRSSTSKFQFLVLEGDTWSSRSFLLSGQSSTAAQVALERLSERIAEQIVDFPVSRGGLPVFRPGQSSSSSSHDPARVSEALDEPGEGFFRTFPQIQKSATQPPHSGSALPPHSSPWTPAACDASMVLEEEEEESEDEPVEFVEYVQHDGLWWSSPAVLLVACRCRWVTGWPYDMAAPVAHRRPPRRWLTSWSGSPCEHAAQGPGVFGVHSVHQQSVVIPVATQRQVCTALLRRRLLRFHSCSSWTYLSFPSRATTSFGTDSTENSGMSQ